MYTTGLHECINASYHKDTTKYWPCLYTGESTAPNSHQIQAVLDDFFFFFFYTKFILAEKTSYIFLGTVCGAMLTIPPMLWKPAVIPILPQHHSTIRPPFHHEGAFKTICLLGCSFMGCSIDYNSLQISLFPPSLSLFLAHPWLNNQKKVTFLRSDFHARSMLGRHF